MHQWYPIKARVEVACLIVVWVSYECTRTPEGTKCVFFVYKKLVLWFSVELIQVLLAHEKDNLAQGYGKSRLAGM